MRRGVGGLDAGNSAVCPLASSWSIPRLSSASMRRVSLEIRLMPPRPDPRAASWTTLDVGQIGIVLRMLLDVLVKLGFRHRCDADQRDSYAKGPRQWKGQGDGVGLIPPGTERLVGSCPVLEPFIGFDGRRGIGNLWLRAEESVPQGASAVPSEQRDPRHPVRTD